MEKVFSNQKNSGNDTLPVDNNNHTTSESPAARAIAFYLPQFHPIPENNKWWGAGFTEWTNVAKAKPLYRGHWQPRLPADLGFYDLRVPETRIAQAKMAKESGIEAFCYWHYWFGNGRRILDRPFKEVVESGQPDFPFCLAWANQSWSGIWHGNPKSVLIEQTYPGKEDEKAHFESMLPAFRDKRYMKIDGKLVFVVFNPSDLPNTESFLAHWQQLAKDAGLQGFYFIAMSNNYSHPNNAYYDAVTCNGPGNFLVTQQSLPCRILRRLKNRNFGKFINKLTNDWLKLPERYDYAYVVEQSLKSMPEDARYIPGIMPNWDNTPRSTKRGVVFERSTPELFRKFLSEALKKVATRPPQHRIVFVKAWNEWAEGNYIEPDAKYGWAYLDVIKSEIFPSRR